MKRYQFLFVGLVLTALIIVLRYIIASGIGYLFNFSDRELIISRLSFPLGTSALVLSQLPLIYDPQQMVVTNPEIYSNLVFFVVLGTVIFSALLGPNLAKWKLDQKMKKEKNK